MNDLVSVIIPTYNRSQLVTEAIDSVLCQTYPNMELIVVNDGSTDDTEEKLRPYMDRIIYIRKENGGVSSAVNAGLRAAKGKYIARLDDDDLFMPDKTEKQVRVFEQDPDVGLVTSACFITDAVGRTISVTRSPDFSQYGPFLTLLVKDWVLIQPTVMVRRECHDKLGFYKNIFAEDYEMFLRISRYWGVGVVEQPLAKYRRHSGNITSMVPENEELLQDVTDFICDILDDIRLTELFPAIGSTSDPHRESCAYAAKGSLYLRHRAFDRAEASFLKALDLCSTNSIPPLWLGISARAQKDFQSAEEYFSRVKEDDGLYPIAENAKDLITAIRKNGDRSSSLLRREIAKEHGGLFRTTFDGISGKAVAEIPSRRSAASGLKLSRYAVIVDNYPQNGKHLVFNTFTHAMVSVGDDLKCLIQNPERLVGESVLKDVRMLKKMGILVSQGLDETEVIRKWYNRFRSDLSKIYATILTTYDCNFACKYCIEEGVKKPVYMDDRCSDALVHWLVNRAAENGTKEISLLFYGGEPLLNTGPIYRISKKLQRFASDEGILVSSSITTNGSLLDNELLQDLTKYGLKSVKITIDGEKEVHDARRPFRSGKGSFDVIMGNIQKVPEAIELIIQANLDEENIGDFPNLLDLLERSGLKDRTHSLVISSVAQSIGLASMPAAQGMDCIKLSDSPIAAELIYMKKLVVERGFESKYDSISYVSCGVNRDGAFVVIDPLGTIYNCPAFVGREEFSIGDIYHPGFDRYSELSDVRLRECFQCTYFPVCGGGCAYSAYMLYGDHTRIACERSFIEHQTKELAKLMYDRKVKERTVA